MLTQLRTFFLNYIYTLTIHVFLEKMYTLELYHIITIQRHCSPASLSQRTLSLYYHTKTLPSSQPQSKNSFTIFILKRKPLPSSRQPQPKNSITLLPEENTALQPASAKKLYNSNKSCCNAITVVTGRAHCSIIYTLYCEKIETQTS